MAKEGYVPLRRGLLDHLPSMCGSDVKCYIALVLLAHPFKGSVNITLRDLGDALGTGANRSSECVRRLEKAGYLTVKRAPNQWGTTQITIAKWRRPAVHETSTAMSTAMSTASGQQCSQQADSKRTASGQHGVSEQGKGAKETLETVETSENVQESTPPPSYDVLPECFQTEHKSRPMASHLWELFETHFGPSWTMKATNRGKVGAAIKEGCDDCDGQFVGDCMEHFAAVIESKPNPGLVIHCLKDDPRPWKDKR